MKTHSFSLSANNEKNHINFISSSSTNGKSLSQFVVVQFFFNELELILDFIYLHSLLNGDETIFIPAVNIKIHVHIVFSQSLFD